ncbi:MAG: hypothetical protein IPL61_20640 [Myxococcales bacterium]|nr:hypothetical protein [Myxococcales bacterium]
MRWSVVAAILACSVVTAAAGPISHDDVVIIGRPQPGDAGYRPNVYNAQATDILYLNRCATGCAITAGSRASDSSASNVSSIARLDSTVPPFMHGDATWDAVVACVRDTYLPYGVEVVTEPPAAGVGHIEMVVAGHAADIGLDEPQGGTLLGIAPATGDCSQGGFWIGYAFANSHANDVIELCATVAHEAGHIYGLEHVFECSDPMTYISNCGQKFFRNLPMRCGTDAAVPCQCGGATSNTHQILRRNVGTGADVPPPMVSITLPAPGPVAAGWSLFVEALDRRGLNSLEVFVNGWSWLTAPGVFNKTSPYTLNLPAEVPPGVMDIEVEACGDTGVCARAAVTVTEGAPCASPDACLVGQQCEAGKCFWAPPSVALGAACTYDQECLSQLCEDVDGRSYCTQSCFGPPNDLCPTGLSCSAGAGQEGVCVLDDAGGDDGGGCCAVDRGGRSPWLGSLGLGAVVGLLIARRRRRAAA